MIEVANGVFIDSRSESNIRNFGHSIACAHLGLSIPSHRSLGRLAMAFKCYHWLKLERYDEVKINCDSELFENTRDLLRKYVRLLVDELPNHYQDGYDPGTLVPRVVPPSTE